jgi:uncharacterized membrane-anchored protein YhcB (DUF1043 family)
VESIEPIWLFGAIVLASGILLGVLLLRLFNPKTGDVEKLQAELDQAHKDMESYKASVNSHFNKTSDLVNELTQDYVKVYRHLAEGAQTLSDTREFTQVLDQPQGQVLITVEAPVEQVPDPDPLVTEAEQTPDPDPLAAQAGQPPTPLDDDAISEGSDAAQISAADDSPEPPADYARVDDSGTETAETVSVDTESVAGTNKDADDANDDVAAVSAEEVTPGENVTAKAIDVEQQAVADETETDSTRKT